MKPVGLIVSDRCTDAVRAHIGTSGRLINAPRATEIRANDLRRSVAPSRDAELHHRNAEPAGLVGKVVLNAGAGEMNDANRQGVQHGVVALDRETFTASWRAEVAGVPAFSDSTVHIVAGLLLPIWKRLPNESSRVYRLQTDEGERIIGRRVSAAWAAGALATGASTLTAQDAFDALVDGRTMLDLAEGLQSKLKGPYGVLV